MDIPTTIPQIVENYPSSPMTRWVIVNQECVNMNVRFPELRNLRPVLTSFKCSGVVNMKTVREFNLAQESIVSIVMYMCVIVS